MPRKKTLEEIKQFVTEVTNGTVQLLSDVYINSKEHLKFRCKCGEIFERSYGKFKQGSYYCEQCSRDALSEKYRTPFSEILKAIEDAGCEYISGEYKNNNSELILRCKCGELFKKDMAHFIHHNQNRCSKCGAKSSAESKIKYDYDTAKEVLNEFGYTLLENEFHGAALPHLCRCPLGHECQITLSQLLFRGTGCRQCGIDINKGTKSIHYINGNAKIGEIIRQGIRRWKSFIRILYNNTCPITGVKDKECDVHHFESFISLFNQACDMMGIIATPDTKLKDFDSYEIYDQLRQVVFDMHTLNSGILLSKSIHSNYHHYCKKNKIEINKKSLDDYIFNNYQIHLDDIWKSNQYENWQHFISIKQFKEYLSYEDAQ